MPRTAVLVRPAIAIFAALLASGCWYSQRPVMVAADSAQPIPTGNYRFTDGEERARFVSLVQFPGGGYIYFEKNEGAMPVLAREVAPGWYVLQPGPEDDEIIYGIAHHEGDRILIYDPEECPEFLSGIAGLIIENGTECRIETLGALEEAAARIVRHPDRGRLLGDPIGILDLSVREEVY